MKKPEDILKGLMFCSYTDEGLECSDECPYYGESCCVEGLMADAAGRIRQLEAYSRRIDADIVEIVGVDNQLAMENNDLRDDIAELNDKLPTWISVEDRLPIWEETVIAYIPVDGVCAAQYWGDQWRRENIGCIRADAGVTVTHWMPLPEPPKESRP